jgi:hypothetical protein
MRGHTTDGPATVSSFRRRPDAESLRSPDWIATCWVGGSKDDVWPGVLMGEGRRFRGVLLRDGRGKGEDAYWANYPWEMHAESPYEWSTGGSIFADCAHNRCWWLESEVARAIGELKRRTGGGNWYTCVLRALMWWAYEMVPGAEVERAQVWGTFGGPWWPEGEEEDGGDWRLHNKRVKMPRVESDRLEVWAQQARVWGELNVFRTALACAVGIPGWKNGWGDPWDQLVGGVERGEGKMAWKVGREMWREWLVRWCLTLVLLWESRGTRMMGLGYWAKGVLDGEWIWPFGSQGVIDPRMSLSVSLNQSAACGELPPTATEGPIDNTPRVYLSTEPLFSHIARCLNWARDCFKRYNNLDLPFPKVVLPEGLTWPTPQ